MTSNEEQNALWTALAVWKAIEFLAKKGQS
jgi:hypothetical protein